MRHIIMLTAALLAASGDFTQAKERPSMGSNTTGPSVLKQQVMRALLKDLNRCRGLKSLFGRGSNYRSVTLELDFTSDGSLARIPRVLKPGRNRLAETRAVDAIQKCAPLKNVAPIVAVDSEAGRKVLAAFRSGR
jgi:hypothetical protein